MSKKMLATLVLATVLVALPSASWAIAEGDTAPLFNSSTLQGEPFALKEFIGKEVVLLNFWSVFCRDCIGRIEAFNKLQDLYRNRNFKQVGIAGDPPTKRMLSLVKKYAARMRYDVILDPELEVYESYGAEIIPYVVLIDTQGKVALVIDSLDPQPVKRLSEAIDRLTAPR